MKYTCKHGFIVPEHLSNFHDHILVVYIFFDVIHVTIFKTDVMMTKHILRVKSL